MKERYTLLTRQSYKERDRDYRGHDHSTRFYTQLEKCRWPLDPRHLKCNEKRKYTMRKPLFQLPLVSRLCRTICHGEKF